MSCLFKDRVVFWSNKKQIQSFLNVKIKKANSPVALTKRYIPSWFGYTTHHVDKSVTNLNEISKKKRKTKGIGIQIDGYAQNLKGHCVLSASCMGSLCSTSAIAFYRCHRRFFLLFRSFRISSVAIFVLMLFFGQNQSTEFWFENFKFY